MIHRPTRTASIAPPRTGPASSSCPGTYADSPSTCSTPRSSPSPTPRPNHDRHRSVTATSVSCAPAHGNAFELAPEPVAGSQPLEPRPGTRSSRLTNCPPQTYAASGPGLKLPRARPLNGTCEPSRPGPATRPTPGWSSAVSITRNEHQQHSTRRQPVPSSAAQSPPASGECRAGPDDHQR